MNMTHIDVCKYCGKYNVKYLNNIAVNCIADIHYWLSAINYTHKRNAGKGKNDLTHKLQANQQIMILHKGG